MTLAISLARAKLSSRDDATRCQTRLGDPFYEIFADALCPIKKGQAAAGLA